MVMITFPESRQTFEYDCGANALQSIFTYYGIDIREEILIKKLKTNEKIGTKIQNIKKVAMDYGFKADVVSMSIEDLKKNIKKGIPVILLLQAWSETKIDYRKSKINGHYVIAIGYDKNNFYFEDPYSVLRTYLSFVELEKRWHDPQKFKSSNKNLALIIYGKKPNYNPRKAIVMP